MIELSPKALRFARLAAEQQPALVDDPHVRDLRNKMRQVAILHAGPESRVISISDDTALFCLKAIDSFLQNQVYDISADWDGNDLQYLEIIKGHLAHGLALDPIDGDRPGT